MRCSYNDGDMNNSLTRAESIDDGIYRLDLVKEKFEKISEDVGEFLIVIDNNLCVVRDNPDRLDLEVLKRIVDIRMKEIQNKYE